MVSKEEERRLRKKAAESTSKKSSRRSAPTGTSTEGGHGGRRGFGPDEQGRDRYMGKDTNRAEEFMGQVMPAAYPDVHALSPQFMDQRQAEQLGATGGTGPQVYMNDTRSALSGPVPGVEKPAFMDTKLGSSTANYQELRANEPDRSLPSVWKKRAMMLAVDVASSSAWVGVRTVAGSGLERGTRLGMTDPAKTLENWARLNQVDSRVLYAQADALRQFSLAAQDKSNPVFVASSALDVVGRNDTGQLVSITTQIDFAHPTEDEKFRRNYVKAVDRWANAHIAVAGRLAAEEVNQGRGRSSPVLTNNRYDETFRPSHQSLRGHSELQASGILRDFPEVRSQSPVDQALRNERDSPRNSPPPGPYGASSSNPSAGYAAAPVPGSGYGYGPAPTTPTVESPQQALQRLQMQYAKRGRGGAPTQ